jgi:hypothetical protein
VNQCFKKRNSFVIENFTKFNPKNRKKNWIDNRKKNPKTFPISLSKNGEISPPQKRGVSPISSHHPCTPLCTCTRGMIGFTKAITSSQIVCTCNFNAVGGDALISTPLKFANQILFMIS